MLIVTVFALGIGFFFLYRFLVKKQRARPLPPGPKGYPIIGNVTDMPVGEEWLTYAEWGRKWGGIVHISLFGKPMFILNSVTIMDEFDKASSIYSDRPVLQMGGELIGFNQNLVLLPYGPRFRTYRKHFSRYFDSGKPMQDLHALIEQETCRFLERVVADHENLNKHLRMKDGGIILRTTYGYEVKEGQDELVDLIERANSNFSKAATPGAFLVDLLPFLKFLPEWLPGTGFLALAREWKKDTVDSVEIPFNFTKEQMALGTAAPSFISSGLGNAAECTEEEIHNLKWAAASMYAGGADTSLSLEYSFFLAMVLFPEVQKKAQAEIDAVVGGGRLPTFTDRPYLPYVNAVVTEVLRWHSVAPLGGPHIASQDGYISGYFIPKGALILANLWNMSHDPATYPDPFVFNPERYLCDEPQRDPRKIVFGYSRRICPGRHLAEASIFSVVVSSLAVFSIETALDENGVSIIPVHESTSGILSHPKPFKCAIKLRSQKAHVLITQSLHC